MGLVALTLGLLALGAYIGRDLSGGWGILAFVSIPNENIIRPVAGLLIFGGYTLLDFNRLLTKGLACP